MDDVQAILLLMPTPLVRAIDKVKGKSTRCGWIRSAIESRLPAKARPQVKMRRPGRPLGKSK